MDENYATCKHCGKTFPVTKEHKAYCSAECRDAYKVAVYLPRYAKENRESLNAQARRRYRARREQQLRDRMVERRLEEVGAC